jgi:hypothetical protein
VNGERRKSSNTRPNSPCQAQEEVVDGMSPASTQKETWLVVESVQALTIAVMGCNVPCLVNGL